MSCLLCDAEKYILCLKLIIKQPATIKSDNKS